MANVTLDQRRAWRLAFMKKLYDITGGNQAAFVDMWELGTELGIPRDEINGVTDHLDGEGLLEYVALGGQIAITHAGRKEVEDALATPDRPTRHFPPINVIHIGSMVNSNLQQGTSGTATINAGSGLDIAALKAFVDVLQKRDAELGQLGDDAAAEARAERATLAAQAASPRPKMEIVRSGLESLKHIFEHAVGHALATELLPMLLPLLAALR